MKKFISLFLFVTCIFILVSCGHNFQKIRLPDISNIRSVDVSIGDSVVNHTDEIWINDIMAHISGAKITSKKSVQDTPQAEEYITIDIQLENGTSRLFVYVQDGKSYIEQPYEGIYESDGKLYDWLQEKNC